MQRYFVAEKQVEDDKIYISGEDAHHVARVMRMKVEDKVVCLPPSGKAALCEIVEISSDSVALHVVKWMDENNELPVSITIAQGLPKGEKLELVIQKGTELGADYFLPFFASRSIVKWDEKKGRKKVDRLEKIAKEAAEQSYRSKLPTVKDPQPFKKLLEESKLYDLKIVAYEEEAKQGEKSLLASSLQRIQRGQRVLAVFGPEGGLTESEVSQLKEYGFIICGLGPRILRTETAPLYFLSAVSYQLELLG